MDPLEDRLVKSMRSVLALNLNCKTANDQELLPRIKIAMHLISNLD
jgi:hypothetical protein